ncbi:hypothetical protein SUGI_0105730 [Cryptomeria japonica]|nr:hypothetical protein SUGI_0105730 [Cryptomeria japonica]
MTLCFEPFGCWKTSGFSVHGNAQESGVWGLWSPELTNLLSLQHLGDRKYEVPDYQLCLSSNFEDQKPWGVFISFHLPNCVI